MSMSETEIIPSVPLERLLLQRDLAQAALARMRDAIADYEQACAALLSAGTGEAVSSVGYKFREPFSNRGDFRDLTNARWFEAAVRSLDTGVWAHLFEQSGLKTFLDAQAREKWSTQIDKNDVPQLTPDNIRATFKALHASRGEMFERGVLNLFHGLSWDFKTNQPVAFGKRLILRHVQDCWGFANHRTCDALDDLMRAFCVLDGQPEPDHRQGFHSKVGAFGRKEPGPPLETPYFVLKVYRNGNGHLAFTRPDLVDTLNKILHKHHPFALASR